MIGGEKRTRASPPWNQVDQQIVCRTVLLVYGHQPVWHSVHVLDAWPNEPLERVSVISCIGALDEPTRIILVKRNVDARRNGIGVPFNILLAILDAHVGTGCPSCGSIQPSIAVSTSIPLRPNTWTSSHPFASISILVLRYNAQSKLNLLYSFVGSKGNGGCSNAGSCK